MGDNFQEYPKYLYHPTLAPKGKIFRNPAETEGLTQVGWVDTPAKLLELIDISELDISQKEHLREACLLAIYEKLGSSTGPDGTLSQIALDQTKALDITGNEMKIVSETMAYLNRLGFVEKTSQKWGGRLTAKGLEHVEKLLRKRSTLKTKLATSVFCQSKQQAMRGIKQIGNWLYLSSERIGEGGNGVVYPTYHKDDHERKTKYAIKILKNKSDPDRIARLRREIKVLSTLDHPNILQVVDHDLNADKPYLVMPFYRKQSLTFEYINTLSAVDRLGFFAMIARAFGHANERGVTHRDIKPENILLTNDGQPMIADFGICHVSEGSRFTATSKVMASRFCTAPEVEAGRAKEISPACDVYCLGKLLYWMFSGHMLPREDFQDIDYDLTLKEPRSTHAFVYQLIGRMILKNPADRIQNGNEVARFAEIIVERVKMDAHVLDLDIPQLCDFCKATDYEIKIDPQWWKKTYLPGRGQGNPMDQARTECPMYGINSEYLSMPWLVLHCPNCGHFQTFRLDGGRMQNWTLRRR